YASLRVARRRVGQCGCLDKVWKRTRTKALPIPVRAGHAETPQIGRPNVPVLAPSGSPRPYTHGCLCRHSAVLTAFPDRGTETRDPLWRRLGTTLHQTGMAQDRGSNTAVPAARPATAPLPSALMTRVPAKTALAAPRTVEPAARHAGEESDLPGG